MTFKPSRTQIETIADLQTARLPVATIADLLNVGAKTGQILLHASNM
jgi:hypothetical protein